MPDLFDVPPQRPAPEHLRHRISAELDTAASRRPSRRRYAVIPLIAASLIGATVLGASLVGSDQVVRPAQTANPVTGTPHPPSSAGPTPAATNRPSRPGTTPQPVALDVRPMTAAEIRRDTRSCIEAVRGTGAVDVRYAMVQRVASTGGTYGSQRRHLVVAGSAGLWVCEDGDLDEWSAGPPGSDKPPRGLAAAPSPAGVGVTTSVCDDMTSVVSTARLFGVTDSVASARVRVDLAATRGAWQTVRPDRDHVLFSLTLTDAAANARSATARFQFLDRSGRLLPVQVGEGPDDSVGTTVIQKLRTCVDERRSAPVQPVVRPADDAAGLKTCRSLIKELSDDPEPKLWRSVLVVSTADEWGAVLTDGRQRVGCSLFPTAEISPIVTDSATLSASAFRFALNPIPGSHGSSLWAAGRVPADVTAITYRLPGRQDVAATIDDDGYWMVKYRTEGVIDTPENVRDWDPVVVTVERPTGTKTYTLPFDEENMCNQISHGC